MLRPGRDDLRGPLRAGGVARTGLFGGNSNWRGPIWFPVNYLLVESLQKFHHYLGDDFTVECPAGSGSRRRWPRWPRRSRGGCRASSSADASGRRPVFGGHPKLNGDPHFRDLIPFHEYFHGDDGSGHRRQPPDRLDRAGRQAAAAEPRDVRRGDPGGRPKEESIMKAVAVFPGKAGSAHLAELPRPKISDVPGGRGVRVEVLRVGVDGTDREINDAEYGEAPAGLALPGPRPREPGPGGRGRPWRSPSSPRATWRWRWSAARAPACTTRSGCRTSPPTTRTSSAASAGCTASSPRSTWTAPTRSSSSRRRCRRSACCSSR